MGIGMELIGLRLNRGRLYPLTVHGQVFLGGGLGGKLQRDLSVFDPGAIDGPVVPSHLVILEAKVGARLIPATHADVGNQDPFGAMGEGFNSHAIGLASVCRG